MLRLNWPDIPECYYFTESNNHSELHSILNAIGNADYRTRDPFKIVQETHSAFVDKFGSNYSLDDIAREFDISIIVLDSDTQSISPYNTENGIGYVVLLQIKSISYHLVTSFKGTRLRTIFQPNDDLIEWITSKLHVVKVT